MKKHYFLIEKFLLFLFYLESIIIMEQEHKKYFWIVAGFVAIVSLTFQGARPYTPIFVVLFASNILELTILQSCLVVVLGFLMVYLKFYHIEIVGKGPYNAGYRSYKIDNLEIGVFYPSMADGSHCKWIPSERYSKPFYDIVFVDPTKPRIPFWLFKFIMSFMNKIKMPVLGDASLYLDDSQPEQKWKLVVFSHGLGSNLTNFSCLCGWWASHGYIVVSVQHDHDHVRIEFDKELTKQPDIIESMFYQNRNKDLQIRAKQFGTIIDHLLEKELLKSIFPEVNKTIGIENVYLAGQSYGGSTVLQTMANLRMTNKASPLIKGLICMDAWYFPLSSTTYQNLKDQNILFLNSQSFFKIVPYIYYMQQKMARLRSTNLNTLKAFIVKKTDHISTSDFSFVLGNILKIMQTIKLQEHTVSVLEFHEIVLSLFMEGKSSEEILNKSNHYASESGLMKVGVYLQEEWRYETDPNYKNF